MKKFLTFVLALFFLTSCAAQPTEEEPENVVSVRVVGLQEGQITEGFTTLGQLAPQAIVNITPTLSGVVDAVFVKPGDRVQANDVLYSIDVKAQKNTLNQTESSLRANRNTLGVQLADARRNYNNVNALFKQGAASKTELDTAQSQLKSLQIRYADAKTAYANQVSNLKSTVNDSDVKAPIGGYVATMPLEVGEVVSAQTSIQLVDDSQFVATSQLTAEQLRRIDDVDAISVYIDGDTQRLVAASIARIDYVQSKSTGTYPIRLTLRAQGDALYDGEYIEVFFSTATRRVKQLPVSAIKTLGQDVYAFYVADGRAVRQAIKTGRYGDDWVEVIDVVARDWIVSNVNQLQDGVKVKVIE